MSGDKGRELAFGRQITAVDALKHCPYTGQPSAQGNQPKGKRCGDCGNVYHPTRWSLCTAYRIRCETCGKFNHWKSVCRSRFRVKQLSQEQSKDWPQMKRENIRAIDTAEPNTETSPTDNTSTSHLTAIPQLYFHSLYINSVSENDTQALLQLQVDSCRVTASLLFKIYTEAEGKVTPVDSLKGLCPQSSYRSDGTQLELTPSSTTITTFGGHIISNFGTCEFILSHHGDSKSCAFHVVNTEGPTILGLPTCRGMKLITLNYGIATTETKAVPTLGAQGNTNVKSEHLQYQDCFHSIGCFQGELHITLDPTVQPVIHPPRRVREEIREPFKKELNTLIEQGIIAKVDEPTD